MEEGGVPREGMMLVYSKSLKLSRIDQIPRQNLHAALAHCVKLTGNTGSQRETWLCQEPEGRISAPSESSSSPSLCFSVCKVGDMNSAC